MKTLVMMVGLPRSGKSTEARKLGFPIVNPDSIRLALHGKRFYAQAEPMVWAIARTMVRALFSAGHDAVILDACNHTRARRSEWKDLSWKRVYRPTRLGWNIAASRFSHAGVAYPFFTDDEKGMAIECRRRAELDGDDEIIPVINKMANDAEPITSDEDDWSEPKTEQAPA